MSPRVHPKNLRRLSTKAAGTARASLTLADQGFSSVSNFAVGVAVARGAGAAGLGGFSLAYAGWLILAALHRSLITDPMAIEGDIRDPRRTNGIRRGFAAELLLGTAAILCFAFVGAGLLFVHQQRFGEAMLALAPWLPCLLAQDYWRWVGFLSRRPGIALANDTVFNCVQGACFAVALLSHSHSVPILIGCWGLGATVGAAFGFWQLRIWPSLGGGLSLLRARWAVGKWIAGSSLLSWCSSQMYVFIVGGILGPVGLGDLKAAQTLATGPAGVLIMAGGSIGLPEASKAYDEKGWTAMRRVTRIIGVAGLLSFTACAGVVVLWGRELLSKLYGPAFGHFELTAVLIALGQLVIAAYLGPVLVIKATRNTRMLLPVQVVSLVVSTACSAALAIAFGVLGAAAAIIPTNLAIAISYGWLQRKAHVAVASAATGQSRLPPDDSSGPLAAEKVVARVG
jgi:O-antigen/teichoic acid export membrane protein